MTAKELVTLLVEQLPADCTYADVLRETLVAEQIFMALKDIEAQVATSAEVAVTQFATSIPQWRAAAQLKVDKKTHYAGSIRTT